MTDTFNVTCPKCGLVHQRRGEAAAGSTLVCTRCETQIAVPSGGDTPTLARPVAGGASLPREAPASLLPPGEGEGGASAPRESRDGDVPSVSADATATLVRPAEEGVTHPAAAPGALDARYDERGLIGQGGMGEVVLCIDRDIRRPIALKRMLPSAAEDPSRRARFVEEAQVTGQLEHPNIVPIHELGRAPDGTAYFTMKLVKGKSLADLLRDMRFTRDGSRQTADGSEEKRRGTGDCRVPTADLASHASRITHHEPIPSLGDLLQIFLKVCDGVAFAHSRGVIHRDLKPANIMVGDYGEVLVMDWGLARILRPDDRRQMRDDSGQRVESHASRVTRQESPPQIASDRQEITALQTMAGSMLGTPAYMSPEQAKGELEHIDARSDIWSLGAILYEILTLERAITGETTYAILAGVLKGNIVPPEQRAPTRNVPRELSAIAMKCLRRTRAHRYGSVLDLKRDLALYLEGRSVSAAPDTFAQAFVKLVKRNKRVSAAIAAAALIIIAVVGVAFVRVTRERDRAQASDETARKERDDARKARDSQRATALAASERFARQAALAAENYRWAEANERLDDAQAVCPDGPWAPYARGRLAQIKGDHEGAIKLFDEALKLAPGQKELSAAREKSASLLQRVAEARKALKEAGKLANWQVAEKIGDTFDEAENWREAAQAYEQALQLLPPNVPRDELENKLGNARAWIACEGFYDSIRALTPDQQRSRILAKMAEIHGKTIGLNASRHQDGRLVYLQFSGATPSYVQPLKGLPLTYLGVREPRLFDLRPLKGMPLERLEIDYTWVRDLGPLRGIRLKYLQIARTRVVDLGPLQGMPLEFLSLTSCPVTDLTPLKGMPLVQLSLSATK